MKQCHHTNHKYEKIKYSLEIQESYFTWKGVLTKLAWKSAAGGGEAHKTEDTRNMKP